MPLDIPYTISGGPLSFRRWLGADTRVQDCSGGLRIWTVLTGRSSYHDYTNGNKPLAGSMVSSLILSLFHSLTARLHLELSIKRCSDAMVEESREVNERSSPSMLLHFAFTNRRLPGSEERDAGLAKHRDALSVPSMVQTSLNTSRLENIDVHKHLDYNT